MNQAPEIIVAPFPANKKFVDLTGKKFGRLTVQSYAGKRGSVSAWRVLCDCGQEKIVTGIGMTQGDTRSCGCLRRDFASDRLMVHGMASRKCGKKRSREHATWSGIKTRCYNQSSKDYPYYGGRGIAVCDRWLKSFEDFLADMGRRPTALHTIERIDSNGNYEPSNCKWATRTEQANNKSNNRIVTVDGFTGTLAQVARHLGIPYQRIQRSLSKQ